MSTSPIAALCVLAVVAAAVTTPPAAVAGPSINPIASRERVPTTSVPAEDRNRVLGQGWRTSVDRAWTATGDANGFHVLVADAAAGYTWRVAATLAEPGFDTDRWVGNACASGTRLAVTYAPRAFTNDAELFDRGGFTALVDLVSGSVTKLPMLGSLAYFSPGCGPDRALFSQFDGADRTRLTTVDLSTGKPAAPITVRGQLTSAVPTTSGIVAADAGMVVQVAANGDRTPLAVASSVPFHLRSDADGGVVYLDRAGDVARVHRVAGPTGRARPPVTAPVLAEGALAEVGLAATADGQVAVTGKARPRSALPRTVRLRDVPKDSQLSRKGELVITEVSPTKIETIVSRTGARAAFSVDVASAATQSANPGLGGATAQATTGSLSDPVEAERTCSVPRNDPRNQVMQPKPRQVEWAVDQAVTGNLTVSRPANWKNLGMPAYTPQGHFPPLPLTGGGRVPAQVFLAVIAQESNLWQAPGSVVPGVTGNPLVGNYYGRDVYNGVPDDDWQIHWADADCGYGVTQLTDGMRLAGRTRPGEVALPYDKQRAVALDFAANVAAGLRVLQDKWNQTRNTGLVVNNGDPAKIENWFFAVWAYNSGFHPSSDAGANSGAWGVGWANNPVNPNYPANRAPFLERTYGDAAHPQDWPYPEKVMGWAGHPVEILESPGTLVAGYRPAWWNGDSITGPANRASVKPPLTTFCDTTNSCDPTRSITPNAPGVIGEPAGPCAHQDSGGRYDLKCWYHRPATWKPDCSYSCGNELLRFVPGYAYQDDGTAYPPACGLGGLPAGALVIDDQPDSVPAVRPACGRSFANQGSFGLSFGADGSGNLPSKVDFHQLGAGFAGHFWYAHTWSRAAADAAMRVTGTWTLNRAVTGWARVFVHMPDHGAHTPRAAYEVDLGNGVRTRTLAQRTQANRWVSLGSFPFSGTPKVRLSNITWDRNDGRNAVDNEDIAFDAVAFQLLPGKPANIVVSLGDSYSSGEGASSPGGADYYKETDTNGDDPDIRNACHRSRYAWSRLGGLADSAETIGARADRADPTLDHHLLACSGAETEHVLPLSTASGPPPVNAFGQTGRGEFGEPTQLDRGFLDENTTLVTLSIGGNDARFGAIIEMCLSPFVDFCQDDVLEGDNGPLQEVEPQVITSKVRPSVVTVLKEVHRKAPNAKILLMGYPRLLESRGACLATMAASEADWVNSTADLLAREMSGAVDDARAAVVPAWFSDPRPSFVGKAVCGSPETVHGVVSPLNKTPGEPSSLPPFVSQQSFHPKSDGQRLYANSMNATLRTMSL